MLCDGSNEKHMIKALWDLYSGSKIRTLKIYYKQHIEMNGAMARTEKYR